MKRTMIFMVIYFLCTIMGSAQNIIDADMVSPMHENRIAIKKGNQWAFIDSEGQIVINYRNDLVATNTDNGNYPLFKNGRCRIVQKKDGISYFGYIDTTGNTIIEPKFLNATNFHDFKAIVLLLERSEITTNVALKKPVVSYDYFEVVIDSIGKVVTYLTLDPTHVTLAADYLRKPPTINSKFISNSLVAVMNNQKKWALVKIE